MHAEYGYRICFHGAEFSAKRGKESWTFYAAEAMVARIVRAPDGINLLVYKPLTELQTLVLSFFTWLMPQM